MKLNQINITWLLTALLIVGFLFGAYLFYSNIYVSFFGTSDEVSLSAVVRVDLPAYQSAIEFLDEQTNFVSAIPPLNHPNPFGP